MCIFLEMHFYAFENFLGNLVTALPTYQSKPEWYLLEHDLNVCVFCVNIHTETS